MARDPLCIACGQPTGPGVRLNHLSDGRACSACADRLLDSLPPALPAPRAEVFEEWAEGDEPGDDTLDRA